MKARTLPNYLPGTACLFVCRFRLAFWAKDLPQTVHLNGLSPLWILRWIFMLYSSPNPLPHTSHLYGFSPVWVILCLLSLPASEQTTVHSLKSHGKYLQGGGFSSCDSICLFKLGVFRKFSLQTSHVVDWGTVDFSCPFLSMASSSFLSLISSFLTSFALTRSACF